MKKILAIALILIGSCKKAPLEVDSVFDIPEEQAINNLNDLEVLVNGAYQSLQGRNGYGAALKLIPDLLSDQIVITPRAYERNTGDFFTLYTRQMFGTADGVWRECYTCINRANAVLDAIEKKRITPLNEVDQQNIDRIQGEAYFLRGLMHFELVRLWGLQYQDGAATPGVILKLTPTRGRYSQPRASVPEVYASVESDLQKAIELLPEDRRATDLRTYGGRVGGRATKAAAKGILARVYFQKATEADDLKSKALIDEIVADSRYAIEGDSFSANGIDFLINTDYNITPSILFQVVNILNPFTNEGNSTVKPLLDSYYPEEEGDVTPFPTIYSMSSIFSDSIISKSNTNLDLRIKRGTQGTNPRYTTKYKSPGASVNLNVPVIRTAELILDRIEINATLGQRTAAIDDIIKLRKGRAYELDWAMYETAQEPSDRAFLQSLSQENFLREVARERSRELFTEGDRLHHFRRFYQRHRLQGTNRMGTARNSYRQENFFEAISTRFLFQIPDAEIAANPAATRN